MAKVLMKGNEAIGAAAIEAGCKYFFGYPITPQNEVPEYMSKELPKNGGVFIQAESEVAAINMVYGAAGAGARVMTSSSSPGIALKQEGISYCAGAELPCVIVNVMRGGPGLGSIQPSQTDYFQATRGGGNGDYKMPVFSPSDVQELTDLVMLGFDKADEYRTPVMVVADGMIGQMMEPVEFKEKEDKELPEKSWSTTGTKGKREPNIVNSIYLVEIEIKKKTSKTTQTKRKRNKNIVNSLYINESKLENQNKKLKEKYKKIQENEVLVESYNVEDADLLISAYGTTARIAKTAISKLEEEGYNVGLIRPITLWPYPFQEFDKIKDDCKGVLTIE